MEENIKLNKEVFAKRPYNKIIDTSFNEFGIQTIQEQLDAQPTVQEFFNLYTELFYQINEVGPTNSHEYLVKTSGEYIAFDEGNDLIEALQLEIANLRKELLESQQSLANSLLPEDERLPSSELGEIEVNVEAPFNPVAEVVNTPLPEIPQPEVPEPSPEDQEMFDDGYQYQLVTWKAMNQNLEFFTNNSNARSKLPEDLGQEKRDLDQIKKKGEVSGEATWLEWKDAIKKRASGKEIKNLMKILQTTVDILRNNFVKTGTFGGGNVSSISEIK
tara:strand:- start:13 stop:834 length:822 start_codon:yes stop_codon:yes gene_type:complete